MINADNGPENSGRRTQWLKRLVELADAQQLTIQLAYYPPYHSKYNPVERLWGVLENHWYRRIYSGQDYPLNDADQALLIARPEDRILFLGLNSCWQLDHHFRERASIHMPALTRALDRLQEGAYDGWLKIAVWHHPLTGEQMMNDEFMQLLAVHNFRICLHGHIHEAIEALHKYDDRRGISSSARGPSEHRPDNR